MTSQGSTITQQSAKHEYEGDHGHDPRPDCETQCENAALYGMIATISRKKGRPMAVKLDVDKQEVAEFCRKNHIRRLALFGSVLREDFGPDSDVDVLVEFDPEHVPGLFGVSRLARDLSSLFGGRHVDLRTAEDLSRYFRAQVVAAAEVQYAK